MRKLVFIALAALTMVACVAPKPKEKGIVTTKRINEQAPKATPTMKDSTPTQRPVVPDTTTKYIEEDGGMTQIESKFFTETASMQALYQETIRRKDIDHPELLLPQLPSKSKSVDVGRNGLISVSYKISAHQVTVEMYYEGGVTTLILRAQNGGVQREIIYSAD